MKSRVPREASKTMMRLIVPSSMLAISLAAGAQTTQVEQIGSRSASDDPIAQVSSGSRDVGAPLPPRRGASTPPVQLSSEADTRPATPQLTGEVESMDEQGIASGVLGTNTPPPAPQPAQPTAEDAQNAAIAQAIVNAIIV